MKDKLKNIIMVCLFASFILVFSLILVFGKKEGYSDSERRALASFPDINYKTILTGEFSEEFEKYATDNFYQRDFFRMIKNSSNLYLFGRKDTNGLYLEDGHISKIEYPENPAMMNNAADKVTELYEMYVKDKAKDAYLCIIPDKGMFLADKHLSIDYPAFAEKFKKKVPFLEYIDIITPDDGKYSAITDAMVPLYKDAYYKTDSHWRQEKILPVAAKILWSMNKSLDEEFTEKTLITDFKGVYAGQSAFGMEEDLCVLESESINNAIVTSYGTGKGEIISMYDMEKLKSKDPYEVFLRGSEPLITIENPNLSDGSHLVIFRDSFASSLAPLLTSAYSKITLVDTRYMMPEYVGNFVDFENADVLFLYSATIINSSTMLK